MTEEQKEIALLKNISEEHQILKKAVNIFSKSDRKNLGA
jgi:transposase